MISLEVLKGSEGRARLYRERRDKGKAREERDSQSLYYRMCIPLSIHIVKSYIKNTIYSVLLYRKVIYTTPYITFLHLIKNKKTNL